jgi:hypothetical protein
MRIKIPLRAVTTFEAFRNWGDHDVKLLSFAVRRIDLLIAIACLICTSYYGYTYGWLGALTGFLMFALLAMIASWFEP